jgi:hypothetical protein
MKVLDAVVIFGVCAVPASALSLIAALVPGDAGELVTGDDVPEDLLSALRAVTDPRCRRGVRHQLVAVLGVAVCAVLAGARSYGRTVAVATGRRASGSRSWSARSALESGYSPARPRWRPRCVHVGESSRAAARPRSGPVRAGRPGARPAAARCRPRPAHDRPAGRTPAAAARSRRSCAAHRRTAAAARQHPAPAAAAAAPQ